MEKFRRKRKSVLEKKFVKKRKVTSEMSTSSSNEKNNEIYYENHDHSIIERVNDDCLAEIFMYIPAWERPKIALVCQKWKRALDYSGSGVKKLQLTHWEQAEYPNCLKKFPTPDGKLSFLKSLLYKCGHYLTQLDLTAYGYSDIVLVINEYCPNLVKLRLRFIFEKDKILWPDAFSRLSKLKVLAVIFQYHREPYFWHHYLILALDSLADTLTDLTLFNWKDDEPCTYNKTSLTPCRYNIPCVFPEDTLDVLRRLKALKRFEFGGIEISSQLEKYLSNNRTLEYYSYDCSLKENVIKPNKLMSITSLDLLRYKVSDHSLYTIANTIKNLTNLTINCKWITNDGVVAISMMNSLNILCFSDVNNSIDSSSIKLLKNLIRLMLPCSNKINDDLATKVLENSPKMDMFFLPSTSVTVGLIKKAAEISRNRKQRLLLAISFIIDKKPYESPYFEIYCAPETAY